jgi:hypothetical protein
VPAGGDVYLLKWILHDWDDAAAVQILRVCRQAMKTDSRRLIVEHLVGSEHDNAAATLMDLHMMVITGGKVRTQTEFGALLDAAGLRLTAVFSTSTPLRILEGAPGGVSKPAAGHDAIGQSQ